MTDRDKIIDKIKKLLRMKRGGTPDEIATALRLAQELAAKHGIDLDGVNPDIESEKPIGHQDEVHGARVSWESKYAALITDQFFKVGAFQSVNEAGTKYVMRFVGEEWDIQIAIYVYRFLCGHFRREWKNRRGRCKKRQVFLYWMYIGLKSKLRERQPKEVQTPGLIKTDHHLARRNSYIDARWKLISDSVKPDEDSEEAMRRGWLAGQQTEINSGVKGGNKREALIVDAGHQLTF